MCNSKFWNWWVIDSYKAVQWMWFTAENVISGWSTSVVKDVTQGCDILELWSQTGSNHVIRARHALQTIYTQVIPESVTETFTLINWGLTSHSIRQQFSYHRCSVSWNLLNCSTTVWTSISYRWRNRATCWHHSKRAANKGGRSV